MPFPLDPNAPVFSPREPHVTLDPTAPKTIDRMLAQLVNHARRATLADINPQRFARPTVVALPSRQLAADIRYSREREAAGARYGREPRAFLRDVAPELPLWLVASIDSRDVEDLTDMALRALMSQS